MKNTFKPGDKIRFAEEKQAYTVIVSNDRYAVCTKPFNLQKTLLYCIVDFVDKIRGPNNLVMNSYRYETLEGCEQTLIDVTSGKIEISQRHRAKLNIKFS